jgi:hypothetical protein
MSFKFENTDEGKATLQNLLHENVVYVTFTKKDGTKRLLRATLIQDRIPQNLAPKEDNPTRVKSEEAQAVYDLDNGGWRSFRWDSVIEYETNSTGN